MVTECSKHVVRIAFAKAQLMTIIVYKSVEVTALSLTTTKVHSYLNVNFTAAIAGLNLKGQ